MYIAVDGRAVDRLDSMRGEQHEGREENNDVQHAERRVWQ
jgi:hypothetical protein